MKFDIENVLKKIKSGEKTECWLWQAGKDKDGYGVFGKSLKAHRVYYEIMFGEIPFGMKVCHKCDNPSCVNPYHLFLGTQNDNIQDMVKKNRQNKGTEVNCAKLNEIKVIYIRMLNELGWTQIKIAKEFNVSFQLISLIVNRKIWKHVD